MKTIEQHSIEKMAGYRGTISEQDQKQFLYSVGTCESGLKQMIQGLHTYCQAMDKHHGYVAGDDGYCGPYLEEVLHGLRGLLSGPGRFDGGTVDSYLCELADAFKLEIE